MPELRLTAEDYEVAAEALRRLEGCFSEVVFVYEVAARNCRERQLREELARNPNSAPFGRSDAKNPISQLKKPIPIGEITVLDHGDHLRHTR